MHGVCTKVADKGSSGPWSMVWGQGGGTAGRQAKEGMVDKTGDVARCCTTEAVQGPVASHGP